MKTKLSQNKVIVQAGGVVGPKGETGATGAGLDQPFSGSVNVTGPFTLIGDQSITGSLTISGSGTFTNIGPLSQTGVSTFIGGTVMSGSLEVTAGITGSLLGTASYADFALSSSHEITFELSSSYAHTASLAANLFGTPSIVVNQVTASGNISSSGEIEANKFVSNGVDIAQFAAGAVQLGGGAVQPAALSGTGITLGISGLNQPVTVVSALTASIISASGDIVANNLSGTNTGDQNISNLAVTGSDVIFGHITASGNMSASGDLFARDITANDITLDALGVSDKPNVILKRGSTTGISLEMGGGGNDNGILEVKNASGLRSIRLEGGGNSFFSQSLNVGVPYSYPEPVGGTLTVGGTISASGAINTLSHITASGNINAVGHLEGGGLKIDGAEIFAGPAILKLQSGSGVTDTFSVIRSSNDRLLINGGNNWNTIEALNADLIATSITASGAISASGVINGQNLFGGVFGRIYPDRSQTSNNQFFTADANGINSNSSFAVTGNVTASNNISASGNINANNITAADEIRLGICGTVLDANNLALFSNQLKIGTDGSITEIEIGRSTSSNRKIEIYGQITASANISASGNITAVTASLQQIQLPDNSSILASNSGRLDFGSSELKLISGDDIFLQLDDTITFSNAETTIPGNITAGGTISNVSTTHVTASGNISASNTVFGVTGSFNQISSNPANVKTNITMGGSNIDIGNTSTAASLGSTSFPFTTLAGSTNFQGMVAATNYLVGSGSVVGLGGIPLNSTIRMGGPALFGSPYTVDLFVGGNVFASASLEVQGGKPITTHTTHFSASLANAGHYLIVGGNLTCSISASTAPVGAEYEFFQTSSAGQFLFETGSGITLISKDENLKLVGQGSAATLKKVGTGTFHLVGDLTS